MKNIYAVIACAILVGCGGSSSTGDKEKPISKTNNQPNVISDSATVFVNENVLINVLGNDTDPDGDALSVVSVSNGANGVAEISNNQIRYTPKANYIGPESLSYSVSDGNGGQASASISITVENVAPIAKNDVVSTLQSTPVNLDLLANDSSQANLQLIVASTTTPNIGQVSIENGVLSYIPRSGYVGEDSFGYVVRDSQGDEATAMVSISVNNKLPETQSDSAETTQNNPIEIYVLANDRDALGDQLTIAGTSQASHGNISRNGNVLLYTPTIGYAGSDSFSYTVVDQYGGASEGDVSVTIVNQLPVANDDVTQILASKSIEIDVLANDVDAEGDNLVLSSLSAVEHGEAVIIDNKLHYTAPVNYGGEVLIGYTIVDSYGAASSAFVTVTVINSIILKGKIEPIQQPNSEIEVYVGDTKVAAEINPQGEFEIALPVNEPASLVRIQAHISEQNMMLKAQYGSVRQLELAAGSERVIEIYPLSFVTTAEFALLEFVNEGPLVDQQQLDAMRIDVDYDLVLELAMALRVITSDNGLSLPNEFTSVNEFLASPFAVRKQLATWRFDAPEHYTEAFDYIFNNEELTHLPTFFDSGYHTLYASGKTSRVLLPELMVLSNDGQGRLQVPHLDSQAMSWVLNDNALTVNVANLVEQTYMRYGENGTPESHHIAFLSHQFKVLGHYPGFKVIIEKATACTEWVEQTCASDSTQMTVHRTRRVHETIASSLRVGKYDLETVALKPNQQDGTPYSDLDAIGATIDLLNDGSFIEVSDSRHAVRSGQWQVSDDKFILNYDNGINIVYTKLFDYQGLPYYQYTAYENSMPIITETSYVIARNALPDFSVNSEFQFIRQPLFDNDLDSTFALPFQTDNTGVQRNYYFGQWNDSRISHFSWSYSGGVYLADYYLVTDTMQFTTYCDINDANCEKWRYREFEVIGKHNDWFIIKNNQGYLPNSVGFDDYRRGYIGLYQVTPLVN